MWVASLSSPSMLAERFITIAPAAGWASGMPGNRRRKGVRAMRPISSVIPPFSAIFMSPSHRLITPVRPSAISKPDLEESNNAATTSFNASGLLKATAETTAVTNAMRKNAAQIQLSMARRMGAAARQRQARHVESAGRVRTSAPGCRPTARTGSRAWSRPCPRAYRSRARARARRLELRRRRSCSAGPDGPARLDPERPAPRPDAPPADGEIHGPPSRPNPIDDLRPRPSGSPGACNEIGRADVWTPVHLIYLLCRLLLYK